MKRCSKCKQRKPRTEFQKCASSKDGLQYRCKKCYKKLGRVRYVANAATFRKNATKKYHDNPAKFHAILRKYHYGITQKQYDQMIKVQKGLCKICRQTNVNGKALSVDHNHKTGRIRGLLCQKCNAALGYFRDDPILLRRGLRYLEGKQ